MPPKRKVKSGKMEARKTRELVSNHPTPTLPTEAETATTQAMNEALDEVLMADDHTVPPPTAELFELRESESKRTELLKILGESEEEAEEREEALAALKKQHEDLEKAHRELEEAHRKLQDDDDDDTSHYSSALRGMSSLPEARQDSRGRQVNLAPLANYIHIPMGDWLCVSAQLPLPFIVCRDGYKKLGGPRGE